MTLLRQLRQKLVNGQHVDAVDPLAAHAEEHDDPTRNLAGAIDKRIKSFQVARVNATRGLDLNSPQLAAYRKDEIARIEWPP